MTDAPPTFVAGALAPTLWPAVPAWRWLIAAGVIAFIVLVPIISLGVTALEGSSTLWPHLAAHVLPKALRDTFFLLAGVGFIVVVVGTGTAWLVSAYDFPGRGVLDWALLLPLAVPTYVVAYAYLDILHPIGPVQTWLRALLDIESPADFRLPDIRSMGGCIILLGFVLYPYVYLTTRAMFLMQAEGLVEAARTLGTRRRAIFRRVALPLARPAIAVGTSVALLEALNDIGASEFLGIRTLTVSIYTTWVTRSDLAGAAQIALVMLALVLVVLVVERWARRHQHYAIAAQRQQRIRPHRLHGVKAVSALLAGLLPIVIGFGAPAAYLVAETLERLSFAGLSVRLIDEVVNTVTISALATVLAVGLGLVVAYAAWQSRGVAAGALARLAGVGYAVPGTVLAIGVLSPLVLLDNALDSVAHGLFGISTGLLLMGAGVGLVYAYVARFLAISAGGIESGLARVPRSLDHASRALGQTAGGTLRKVHLPLIRPAIGAAALLVFVDCMKELPATLLLRPLNFETLSTHLYAEAARGTYEDGAIAALLIVLVGLVAVVPMAKLSRA